MAIFSSFRQFDAKFRGVLAALFQADVDGSSELPDYVQQRVRIIQQLLAVQGTKTYTQV